jgi:hypothetical protein
MGIDMARISSHVLNCLACKNLSWNADALGQFLAAEPRLSGLDRVEHEP